MLLPRESPRSGNSPLSAPQLPQLCVSSLQSGRSPHSISSPLLQLPGLSAPAPLQLSAPHCCNSPNICELPTVSPQSISSPHCQLPTLYFSSPPLQLPKYL